jgi:hypothetical protein
MTWHYQDEAGVARTPTRYAERRTTSVAFLRWDERLWSTRRARAKARARAAPASIPGIIGRVFGANASEARAIAYRESHYETTAVNGQYRGIFQMGSRERTTYATIGYATAYEQVVAAHNMFRVRGFEPWTCCE